jgi:hypothetical protein
MNAKRDWIGTYSNPSVKKFQQGGAMAPAGPEAGAAPEQGGAPAGPGQGGGDIEGMIAEYAQTRDPQLAVAICDMIVEMMAQQGGGGAAPQAGGAPPQAKKGMKLKRGPVFKGKAEMKAKAC